MKKLLCALFFMFYIFSSAAAVTTTAQSAFSLGMSGAHSAVASGLEALMYNPAGIATAPYQFGVNVFGNLTLDMMTNFFSIYDLIEILDVLKSDNPNVDDFFSRELQTMSPNGISLGGVSSISFFSFFAKLQSFSIGFSLDNKIVSDVTIGKNLFWGLFDKLSLLEPLKEKFYGRVMWYQDFKFALSAKIPNAEKHLPIRGLYAGFSGHFYLPIMYTSFYSDLTLHTDTPNDLGIYTFSLDADCKFIYSSVLGEHIFKNASIPKINELDLQSILNGGENFGMGLGIDLGLLVDINKYIKVGLSVTDLGFMFYTGSQRNDMNRKVTLDVLNASEILDSLQSVIDDFDDTHRVNECNFFMPMTAVHFGFSVSPLNRRDVTLTLPASFSVGDFYPIAFGDLPTFELATGVELMPIFYWFEMPLRISVGFSSSSGVYSGLGIGFHFATCQFELGVKGLESLFIMPSWMGRDFAVGCSVNFIF